MQIDPKGLEAAKSEGYALGVHEGRVELIVRAYLSALSAPMLVDMGSGRRWMTPALSPAGTASEMEPVAWEGYWDGAGSISSETRYTRSIAAMERWAADGAKITPLYALPPKTEGWRPIETAPRDGTRVDLWQQGHRFTDAFWDEGEEWWCIDSRYSDGEPCPLAVSPEPTHWMPLPAPPNVGE